MNNVMKKTHFLLPLQQIYMCGHSLGPMPKAAKMNLDRALHAWSLDAVKAWNTEDWINLPHQTAAMIAPLIGALKSDIVMSDSTSVNLFKVLMSALAINHKRHVILTTEDNFPADLYIAEGIQALNQRISMKVIQSDELLENLTEDIAVLMLTHVNYRDARILDMAHITRAAHQKGILTVWDLSHSTGALPLNLTAALVDFAVGCTYKYLNGGPGAPAFIYVNERHQYHLTTPIYGWMGHDRPFAFETHYHAKGMAQYLGGTPYVLGLKALEGALEIFNDVDLSAVRQQSLTHSAQLIDALEQLGLHVITPKTNARGGHVAFLHHQGYALSRALIDQGVAVDYREPGLIRLCVNPLYLNEIDINTCIELIRHTLETNVHQLAKYQHQLKVT